MILSSYRLLILMLSLVTASFAYGDFSQPGQVGEGWNFTHILKGDFTGDGKDDLIGRNDDGRIFLYEFDADAPAVYPWIEHGVVGVGWNFTDHYVGDFTGDGKADVIGRLANGDIFMYEFDFDAAAVYPWMEHGKVGTGWNFTSVIVGDFNGNGKDELFGRNANGKVYLYEYIQ